MRTLLMSLLAVAVLAAGALAHTVDNVSPASGSTGTSVTITGTGFGTKKPSVFLTSPETGTKKFKLKVTSSTDTSIVATVGKGVIGSFDVNVKVGTETVTVVDQFSLVAPAITAGQTATADVGTSVTLNGTDFGTKPGKVSAGGKKATVTNWTDTAVTFTVPTTIPNGAVVLGVTNGLGTDYVSGFLTVTGSSTPLGTNKVSGKINGKKFKPLIHFIFFSSNVYQLQMTELGKHARTLQFTNVAVGAIPTILDGNEGSPPVLTLSIANGGGTFDGLPGEFTITITHLEDNKFGGAISGTVTGDNNQTLAIQDVEFIYDTGL